MKKKYSLIQISSELRERLKTTANEKRINLPKLLDYIIASYYNNNNELSDDMWIKFIKDFNGKGFRRDPQITEEIK